MRSPYVADRREVNARNPWMVMRWDARRSIYVEGASFHLKRDAEATAHVIHYGTPDGAACGAHFSHSGLSVVGDTSRVDCRRCARTAAFEAAMFDGGDL